MSVWVFETGGGALYNACMGERLKDKVIIVTGAAGGGLGRAFSARFAEEGAKMVCADIKDVADTVAQIKEAGGEATGVHVDISDFGSAQAMCQAAEEAYGGIDGLVNNAAISSGLMPQPFTEIDDAAWDRVMGVNVKGTWHCCKAVYPYMVKRGGGSIVNISSSTIIEGGAYLAHYVASKGAVYALTRSISREVGEHGIRCNSITPGFTLTEGVLSMEQKDAEQFKRMLEAGRSVRSLKRDALPEDVVGAALFLISDDSRFITGQNINVEGGVTHY